MMKILLRFFLVVILSSVANYGQSDQTGKDKEISFKSWKKGPEIIASKKIDITLSSKNKTYQKLIVSNSGKNYRLQIVHTPYAGDVPLEHWRVELYELLPAKDHRKSSRTPNLLVGVKDPPGKDYPLIQDYAGVLYPRESPFVFTENDEPDYGDGLGFYYIKTIRKIEIEKFCMFIKVNSYRFNKTDEDKIDELNLTIEFSPVCKIV